MILNKLRNKIQKRIEESAWTLAGMKAYERVRVELVIWTFMFFVAVLGLFSSFWFGLSSVTYLILMAVSLLAFLGKAVQFRHFYMLNKIREGI